jgi:hypothetical protein
MTKEKNLKTNILGLTYDYFFLYVIYITSFLKGGLYMIATLGILLDANIN